MDNNKGMPFQPISENNKNDNPIKKSSTSPKMPENENGKSRKIYNSTNKDHAPSSNNHRNHHFNPSNDIFNNDEGLDPDANNYGEEMLDNVSDGYNAISDMATKAGNIPNNIKKAKETANNGKDTAKKANDASKAGKKAAEKTAKKPKNKATKKAGEAVEKALKMAAAKLAAFTAATVIHFFPIILILLALGLLTIGVSSIIHSTFPSTSEADLNFQTSITLKNNSDLDIISRMQYSFEKGWTDFTRALTGTKIKEINEWEETENEHYTFSVKDSPYKESLKNAATCIQQAISYYRIDAKHRLDAWIDENDYIYRPKTEESFENAANPYGENFEDVNYAEILSIMTLSPDWDIEHIDSKAFEDFITDPENLKFLYIEQVHIQWQKRYVNSKGKTKWKDIDGEGEKGNPEYRAYGKVTFHKYELYHIFRMFGLDPYGYHYKYKNSTNLDILRYQRELVNTYKSTAFLGSEEETLLFDESYSEDEVINFLGLNYTAVNTSEGIGVAYRELTNITDNDIYLLAQLVINEAGGEIEDGKIGVAEVVLNRVRSSKFPNSIREVIYAPGQFSNNDRIKNHTPDQYLLDLITDVISGKRYVFHQSNVLFFQNAGGDESDWTKNNAKFFRTIGNHQFYTQGEAEIYDNYYDATASVEIGDGYLKLNVKRYAQGGSSPWAKYPFGQQNIAHSGCSLTAMLIIAQAISGIDVSKPPSGTDYENWFDFFVHNRKYLHTEHPNAYYANLRPSQGTLVAEAFGLRCISHDNTTSVDALITALEETQTPLLIHYHVGAFTGSGHFSVLTGYDRNKQVFFTADPAGGDSGRLWEVSFNDMIANCDYFHVYG